MALQRHLEMNTGVILPQAYVRITEGVLSLDRGIVFVTVQTYADVEARNKMKVPVLTHEVKCTHEGASPEKQAKYIIELNNVQAGSRMDFNIKLSEESIDNEIEFVEGTNMTTDGTLGTITSVIVDKLNKHTMFSADFVASSDKEGEIVITPSPTGSRVGSKGNGLSITGSVVNSLFVEEGRDRVRSDFEKFFGIEVMDVAGNNVIKQAYEFIKTLPEYEGSVDVL